MGTKTALRTWVLGAVVAMASILAPVGTGRAADDPEAVEAKKHYEEGTKAFNLGEYPRAITEFKATYNAKPDPLLLYNIAQSYRLQGDPSQALFFYKSFLRNMPNAPNRKEVEGRIKTLEKQIAEQKTDQKKEPAAIAPIIPPPAAAAAPAAPAAAQTNSRPTAPSAANAPPAPTSAAPSGAGAVPGLPSAPLVAQGAGVESGAAGEAATPSGTPSGSTKIATLPSATAAATTSAGAPTQVDLTAPATPTEEPNRPIYKKWWFWVGSAAAVLVVGGVIAASVNKPPHTPLGTYIPTFM